MAGINLFGFELVRKKPETDIQPQITAPIADDGAIEVSAGGYFGTYLDLEASFKNEADLVSRYREMSLQPELESAIDEIVNEAIVHDESGKSVTIILDDLEQPEEIKEAIRDEFKNVLKLLNFSNDGSGLFRDWYIDGRLFFQVLVDRAQPQLGIQELVYIDPRKIKKVRTVEKKKDPRTGADLISGVQEFYVFNDKATVQGTQSVSTLGDASLKIAVDAIVNINSGLLDPKRQMVLSYLHKAIKPLNQLRMVEDAVVIYRLSRAPERRVFYIDVGNMPRIKADQYLRDFMTKFRNKVVYDSSTGEVKDDRKFMSIMEDFWIPRRGEGKSTEITTLPPGQNLGEMSDVKYFEQKLYKSLNIPITRLESGQGFMLGRTQEITRDEIKFNKFIEKLRSKFTVLFDELMERQLALKGIASIDEWKELREKIHYDFLKDNNFSELRETDLINSRMQLLMQVEQFTGRYFSKAWVQKNVLHLDEEEVGKIDVQIELERMKEQQEMIQKAQEEAAMNQQIMQIQAQYAPPQEQMVAPEQAAAAEQQAAAQQPQQ
jgi:hypothetical protein